MTEYSREVLANANRAVGALASEVRIVNAYHDFDTGTVEWPNQGN